MPAVTPYIYAGAAAVETTAAAYPTTAAVVGGIAETAAECSLTGGGCGFADYFVGGATAGIAHRLSPANPLQQDQNISRDAPDAIDWRGRSVGNTPGQNARVQADALDASIQGALDIRINQHQVNALGQRVGINRPDLQYTLNGQRYYVEYERFAPPQGRGSLHEQRILNNDPLGAVITSIIPH